MSFLKALQLGVYLIGAPGAAGTAAHFLSSKYVNFMNFDGQFFLVKAVTNLYDSGIPEIPESIKNAVEKIVKRPEQQKNGKKRKKRETQQQVQAQQAQQPEIFSTKKYWCRYFDFSRGSQHVVMEYDPDCTLYNIFSIPGGNGAGGGAGVQASAQSTINKPAIYDISEITKNEKTLESLKLKNNNEYKKGGFYLLSLDKSKFSRLNTLTNIELTEAGTNRTAENTYQKKITTLSIKAPLRGDTKDLTLSFIDDKIPSSMLLLKKIPKQTSQVQVQAAGSSSGGGDQDNSSKSYSFKHSSGSSTEKLPVVSMWGFPPILNRNNTQDKDNYSKLDLRLLDKVNYDDLKNGNSRKGLGLFPFLFSVFFKNNGQSGTGAASSITNYYLAKTLSDFWQYKAGDKIKLYEESSSKAGAAAGVQVDNSTGSTQETEVAEFEIVSGVLTHLASPLKCVPNSKTQLGYLLNLRYKHNYATTGSKKVYSLEKNPTFCAPKPGIPPYTIIFLGKDILKEKATQ